MTPTLEDCPPAGTAGLPFSSPHPAPGPTANALMTAAGHIEAVASRLREQGLQLHWNGEKVVFALKPAVPEDERVLDEHATMQAVDHGAAD